MLITRHCSLTQARFSPRWVCSEGKLWKNETLSSGWKSTWRSSACFAILQPNISSRGNSGPSAHPTSALSPSIAQISSPEIQNPYRQTEMERQRGLAQRVKPAFLLDLESCWGFFFNSEKPLRPNTVWLGLTSNSSTNADDCDLPAIIGLTGRTPSSTPPHSWVGEPEQGQQDQALIN